MTSPDQAKKVELGSVDVSPGGESFVLGLVAANEEVHRMELPAWAVYQLMRILPRLDAALVQARDQVATELVAHPVVQWSVSANGVGASVAMNLKNDQRVESAFLLAADDARAIHAALGEALVGTPARFNAAGAARDGKARTSGRRARPTS